MKHATIYKGIAWGVVIAVVLGGMVACGNELDKAREAREAKRAAYADHVRTTCKLVERNRPHGQAQRYDVYSCDGIPEWVNRDDY